jgi:uncharacterized protein YjbI with pentapeptide repeats
MSILVIPKLLYPSLSNEVLEALPDEKTRIELQQSQLKLQNDAQTALLQGVGGLSVLIAAGIGASVTLRQMHVNRELTQRQLRISEEGQITERFTRAIDQLGHTELDIRLGAIYALERIAVKSESDQEAIVEILTSYVRYHSPWPARHSKPGEEKHTGTDDALHGHSDEQIDLEEVRLRTRSADIQAAMVVLMRIPRQTGRDHRLQLDHVDLRGLDLSGANLEFANLSGANLEAADLDKSNLRTAWLTDACLKGASLNQATLDWADLTDACLEHAELGHTSLVGAFWGGANFEDADMLGANLKGALLSDTRFRGASMDGAQFQDTNPEHAQLSGAAANETTVWPEGFDPDDAGIIPFRYPKDSSKAT